MVGNAIRTSLLLGVATSGMMASVPALAQDSATASASESAIIVTARRVEENLQDVPISMTVFNQDQIDKNNIAVATDLATYTPSLSVNQRYGPEKASYSLRGFNQDSNTAPTVGVYFAEVVGVRAQGGTTSGNTVGAGAFTDLENVQVLKGPQGTLFGRNTTGGAVMLTPKKPTDNLEGYIEGSIGNYDMRRVQAAVNVPLADTFKVRLAVDRNKRDGYMKNQSGIGPKDYNDLNYTYLRLSIVADLTPDLENYTIAHYSKSKTNGYASRIIGCAREDSAVSPLVTNPGALDDRNPSFSGTRLLGSLSCAGQLARQDARGDSLYDFETAHSNPFLNIEQWQIINTTTWQASDSITVKNTMSYGEFRERAAFNLYTTNPLIPDTAGVVPGDLGYGTGGFDLQLISPSLPAVTLPEGTPYKYIVLGVEPGRYNSAQSTFTEELQVQFESPDGKFNGVLGGYLEFSRPIGLNAGRTGIFLDCENPAQPETCGNPLIIGNISQSQTQFDFDNHGIFAQGTYNFTDQLALTVGGRYTFDKIVGYDQSVRVGITPLGVGPDGTLRCRDSFRFPATDRPAAGLLVSDPAECGKFITEKSNEPTWVVNLDYKPIQDVLLYAKYARGYRQGGISFTNPGVETWGPEKLDSFELGAKTSFRGGAVSGYFNLAGFYNKLDDMQVFAGLIADPASGVSGGNPIVNAGKARSYGLEVDASARFFDSLRFDVGYTYLNTKIQELDVSDIDLTGTPFLQITPRSNVGQPFNLAPKHKLSVTGTYTLPLDESLGELAIGATWIHTSSYFTDQSAPASLNGFGVGRTPSTNLVNLNVTWDEIAGSPFDAAFFVTNLTKEKYATFGGTGYLSAGYADVTLNAPRMYGLRLRYNFGQ